MGGVPLGISPPCTQPHEHTRSHGAYSSRHSASLPSVGMLQCASLRGSWQSERWQHLFGYKLLLPRRQLSRQSVSLYSVREYNLALYDHLVDYPDQVMSKLGKRGSSVGVGTTDYATYAICCTQAIN
ncbi:unnamed protein product [Protopolystoma xenopodis]|uniref:Uncharacterized protein n=1 Tax=Protopolystoma xenopodis TaxID=117903 RepID=A0A448XCV3_9PLAT|nr:unnamed protein product [Protopolystoma xenopodis]